MTKHQAAPMPEALRHMMRATQHPARAIDCPHCGAHNRRPCTTRSGRRTLTHPHPARVSAWAQTVACCPHCQVEPGIPCHTNGYPRDTVHADRHHEAEATAA